MRNRRLAHPDLVTRSKELSCVLFCFWCLKWLEVYGEVLDIALPQAKEHADCKRCGRRRSGPHRQLHRSCRSRELCECRGQPGDRDQAYCQAPRLGFGEKASHRSANAERDRTDQSISTPERRLTSHEYHWILTKIVAEPIQGRDWRERSDQDLRTQRDQKGDQRDKPQRAGEV